jgi:hypothetical protein
MKKFLGLLGVLVAIICVSMSCGTEEINAAWNAEDFSSDTLSIKVGQSVVASTGERLTFEKLVHDSRCPANAMCVWQGMVTVEMSIQVAGNKKTFSLSADPGNPEAIEATLLGYKVTLVHVWPYPGTTIEEVKPSDYVVEVTATKVSSF